MTTKRKYPRVSTRMRDFRRGGIYHIFQRSNHGRRVFTEKVEMVRYLDQLFFLARRYSVKVHNFVLMGTHVHFVLETGELEEGISKLMQELQSGHAREHNELIGRKGNLWRQHFGCKEVKGEAHYRTLMTYVENNPVKVGKCLRAENYLWSGARVHAEDGPVVLRVNGVEVKVDLYLDKWREVCGPQKEGGWAQYLRVAAESKEMLQQVEMVMDEEARLRFANEQWVKQREESKKAERAESAIEKRVGPGRAAQMRAEKRRMVEENEAKGPPGSGAAGS